MIDTCRDESGLGSPAPTSITADCSPDFRVNLLHVAISLSLQIQGLYKLPPFYQPNKQKKSTKKQVETATYNSRDINIRAPAMELRRKISFPASDSDSPRYTHNARLSYHRRHVYHEKQ